MKPPDEQELSRLLRQWEAPSAPDSLRDRVMPRRRPWWHWLLTGTLRVPVPVAAAILLLASIWAYANVARRLPEPPSETFVSLADFQPVMTLQPVLVAKER